MGYNQYGHRGWLAHVQSNPTPAVHTSPIAISFFSHLTNFTRFNVIYILLQRFAGQKLTGPTNYSRLTSASRSGVHSKKYNMVNFYLRTPKSKKRTLRPPQHIFPPATRVDYGSRAPPTVV